MKRLYQLKLAGPKGRKLEVVLSETAKAVGKKQINKIAEALEKIGWTAERSKLTRITETSF